MAQENYKVGIEFQGDSSGAKSSLKIVKDGLKDVESESKKADKASNQYTSAIKRLSTNLVDLAKRLRSLNLNSVSNSFVAMGKNIDKISGKIQGFGRTFSAYVTAPLTALAVLSLRDKLGGEFRELAFQAKQAGDSFANFLLPAVQKIIGLLQQAFKWFNSLNDSTKNLVYTISLLVAAIGPALLIIGGIGKVVAGVVIGVGVLTKAFAGLIAILSGPAGVALAVGAVIGFFAGLVNVLFKLREATGSWREALGKLGIFILDVLIKGALDPFLLSIQGILWAYEKLIRFMKMNSIADAIKNDIESIKSIRDQLNRNVINSFNDIKTDLESVGSGWMDALTFGMSTKFQSFKDAMKEMWAGAAAESRAEIEKEIDEFVPKLIDVNQIIGDTFMTAMNSAVEGTRTLGQAFRDFAKNALRSIAQVITQMLVLNALKSAFPALSGVDIGANALGTTVKVPNPAAKGFARGGELKGPGTSTSDSIPFWGSNGEYILNAEATRAIGVNNLDRINNAHRGKRQRFADGGELSGGASVVLQNSGEPKRISGINSKDGVISIMLEDERNNGPYTRAIKRRFNLQGSGFL